MTERAPLAWGVAAFACGILFQWKAGAPPAFLALMAVAPALGTLRLKRLPEIGNLLVLLALLGLGAFRAWVDERPIRGGLESRCSPARVVDVQGRLISDSESRRYRGQAGWFLVEEVATPAGWTRSSGRVQIRIPLGAGRLEYGQKLRVQGLLRKGRRDPEKRWLWTQGACGVLEVSDPAGVTRQGLSTDFGSRYRRGIARFRWKLEQIGQRLLEPPASLYLEALVLGKQADLSGDSQEAFRRTGTIHVLVVSGLHVGLIGSTAFLGLTLLRVPRTFRYAALAAILASYCFLTGMKPPILRATLTGILFCWGKWKGLPASGLNLLGAAGLLILAAHPRALADVSFQLSFSAVAGLLLFGRRFPSLKHALLRALGVSGAAWLATTPLLAWHFQQVSWIGPLANLVVVPWASLLIAVGLLVYGTGGVSFSWALPFAEAFQWLLSGMEHAVIWMSQLPGASLEW